MYFADEPSIETEPFTEAERVAAMNIQKDADARYAKMIADGKEAGIENIVLAFEEVMEEFNKNNKLIIAHSISPVLQDGEYFVTFSVDMRN